MSLLDSMADLGAGLVNMAKTRVQLVGLDLEDAIWRAALVLATTLAATLLAVCASLFGASAFIVRFWATDAIWALLVVAGAYLAIGAGLLGLLLRWSKASPFLMRDSIDTLREDANLLAGRR